MGTIWPVQQAEYDGHYNYGQCSRLSLMGTIWPVQQAEYGGHYMASSAALEM